jgi:hypothetical protein
MSSCSISLSGLAALGMVPGGDLVQPDPLDELVGSVDHDHANLAGFLGCK